MMTTTPYALYATAHPLNMLHGMPPSWLYGFDAHAHWPRFDAHDHWRRARTMEKTMHKALRLQERAIEAARQQVARAQEPPWRALNEYEAEITLRLPALADDSLAARVSEDGRSLTVTGSVDSCACQDAVVAEIQFPYGHSLSAEDIELSLQDGGLLTVKALRKKPSLGVKIVKASPPPEKPPARDAQAEEMALESKFKIAVASVVEQASVVEKMKTAADVDVDEGGAREPEAADEKKTADEPPEDEAVPPPSGSGKASAATMPEEGVAVQDGEA